MFFVISIFNEKIFLKNEKSVKKLKKNSKCKVKKFEKYDDAKEYLSKNYAKKIF